MVRGLLLAIGAAWSTGLGANLLLRSSVWPLRTVAAVAAWLIPVGSVTTVWIFVFYVW
jgi:hypothetical protein